MHGPLSLKNKMLSTPLIDISKTSTPIRSRVVSSNLPMNSTPISQLKIGTRNDGFTNIGKENVNVMNFNSNNVQPSQCMNKKLQSSSRKDVASDFRKSNAFSKTISFGDYKTNQNCPT